MTDVCYFYIAIMKPFNFVQIILFTINNLFVLDRDAWNHLTVEKKWALACLKILSTKCVYKSCISNIYV